MIRLKKILLGVAMTLLTVTLHAQTATPVEAYGQLSVSGNKMISNNTGQPVQLRGMSLFWSQWEPEFYTSTAISQLRNDWCTDIVRAAMAVESGGYLTNATAEENKVRAVIDAAIDQGMYVIVDWHDHNAHNHTSQAVDFFSRIAQDYGSYPNIIYEVFNEPLNISWSGNIKPYCESVIAAIRQHDPNNIIVCGTPQWSQRVDQASNDPITSSTNIMYTLHYYAGSHGATLRSYGETAMNNGIALFVTEFGTVNADGNGAVNEGSSNTWFSWMDSHDLSYCNWSLCDKDEGSAALSPGTGPNDDFETNLTTSGSFMYNHFISTCPDYGNPPDPVYIDVPSKVEAEDYSSMSGIQTETTTDAGGGQNVGYIDNGDWIEFNINATVSGNFNFEYRLASNGGGGSFELYIDNTYVHTVNIGDTGGWQNWISTNESVNLSLGQHTMRLEATGGGWNINYIDITANGVVDCNGDPGGSATIDDCGECSGGNTGVTPNSSCVQDCNGDWGGTAAIDGCGVCAGGNTGVVPGESCGGGCQPGFGPNGIYDDFTLDTDPFNDNGGVYSWGEADLGGDSNPNFQAIVQRNAGADRLDVEVTQAQGEYIPFGFSFGESPVRTIDISSDGTFEFEFENTSSDDININIAIQDVNGDLINTFASANGQAFGDAYLHAISTSVNAGATRTYSGDFSNGYYADYGAGQYVSTFDYTQVATVLITVVNQDNTGAPNYQPLAISGTTIEMTKIKIGDCSGAYNDNGKDCNGEVDGTAYVDDCGVCAGGSTGITPNSTCTQDCNGEWDGTASVDDCGVCSGGNTGVTPNSTCTQDCNGEWDGTASVDNCGVCSGGSTGITPNSTCSQDCNGEWDGTASVDDCGVCSGGNTGVTPNSTCTQDCNGEWDGTASVDNCGVCSGGSTGITPNSTCTQDCNGEWDGTASVDNCGVCSGGSTGITPNSTCSQDCNGEWGGTAYLDGCNNCVAGNTGQLPCDDDCAGVPGGSASVDNCGVCSGGTTGITPNSTCSQDCNGQWGGTASIDDCGICSGGNTGITPNSSCTQDCNGDWGGTAYIDGCSNCVGGNTGALPCGNDCAGVAGGSASVDNCGVCSGGNTGITPNSTCTQDCNGDWGGSADYDVCNICSGGNTGQTPETNPDNCINSVDGLVDGVMFKVYPNPFENYLTIEVNNDLTYNYTMTNLHGQVVSSRQGATGNLNLSLDNMSGGVYLVKISYSDSTQIIRVTKL